MKKNQATRRFGVPMEIEDENPGTTYDYIKLAGGLQSNAKTLQQQMSGAEGKTSVHNIQSFLHSLQNMSLKTHHYKQPVTDLQGTVLEWPAPITHTEKGKAVKKHRAMACHATPDSIYIHLTLLLNHSGKINDPVLDTIMSNRFKI